MSSGANQHVVNLYIHDQIDDLPDSKDIAAKYNVDDSEDENDISVNNHSFTENDFAPNIEMSSRLEVLVKKMDEKNREIDRLCTLMEAMSVPPGVDPSIYMDIYEGNVEHVDFRDTKIVSLAKKSRNLTVALNKERAINANSSKKIEDLQDAVANLKREIELISSPAARAVATRSMRDGRTDGDISNGGNSSQKELQQAQKQMEEMKRKYTQSLEENKKLARALTKELGDGVSLDQAVDEGWRGRAQQIVMLKAKIRKLEAGGGGGGVGGPSSGQTVISNISSTSYRSSTTTGSGMRSNNVDAKAEEELNSMSSERKIAVEALTEDYARINEENLQLKQKADRYKARVRALETDSATNKEQLKVLVEKTDSDDQLIEALRSEVQKLRTQLSTANSNGASQSQNGNKTTGAGEARVTKANAAPSNSDSEFARLQRLCRQQASQLETQEEIIKKLRASK